MKIYKAQPEVRLSKDEFIAQYLRSFYDPNFNHLRSSIEKIAEQAWKNYDEGRKAPVTEKAGNEFHDPEYDLSVEWKKNRDELRDAQKIWTTDKARILVINASPRSEHTCPGESSKSFRLAQMAVDFITAQGMSAEMLDLSRITAEYGKKIYPCKACVSTAMPLCHWPCSCYPNHSLAQIHDWMAEIYLSWVRAHGILIITPVHWYQTPSTFKLMMDRLVCADGGNPDPTTTQGKNARMAKDIEINGWDYPQHLAGRTFGIITHGDSVGAETIRRDLVDWLTDMGLISAGPKSRLDGYIGYFESYAKSHEALEKDTQFVEECRIVVAAVIDQVRLMRKGQYHQPAAQEEHVRIK